MKNKIALTVLTIISLSGISMAQHGKDHQQHYDKMSQELQLTDAQRTQMQDLHKQMKVDNQALHATKHKEMQNFYNQPKFNEAEAIALINKNRDAKAVLQMKHKHAMTQILTPEQRLRHAELMQNHRKHGKKHRHHSN